MATKDDAAKDERDERPDLDPSSGQRLKRQPGVTLQMFLAEFERRSAGLAGAELDAEVDRLLDRIVERHVAAAPPKLQDEVRATLRETLLNDPLIGDLVTRARKAAAAGR